MQLVQVAQHVSDLDRATAFYTVLTGSPPTGRFDPPGLVFFDLDRVRLLLETGAPTALLYLRVSSVRERFEELRSAGVALEGEPHVIFRHDDDTLGPSGTQEWQGFLRDSEGNLVALVSWEPAEPAAP